MLQLLHHQLLQQMPRLQLLLRLLLIRLQMLLPRPQLDLRMMRQQLHYLHQQPKLLRLLLLQLQLLRLLYSLILVSFPVEIWRQPYIPDTGTASFELKLEPIP